MGRLSDSEVYEQGLEYWPYIASWKKVLDYITENSPENGTFLDPALASSGLLIASICSTRSYGKFVKTTFKGSNTPMTRGARLFKS